MITNSPRRRFHRKGAKAQSISFTKILIILFFAPLRLRGKITLTMKTQFLSLLFLISSSYLFSCECPALQPISKVLCKNYNVIFYGKVDSVSACDSKGMSIAYFTIKELYKGTVSQNIKVNFDCASECLMSFTKGEQWIVYGTYPKFDMLTVKLCEHSRKYFDNEKDDFYFPASNRTFEEEKQFLKNELGIQPFIVQNDLNEQQKIFKPHNDQPSDWTKLWLLLTSLGTMAIILYFTRKKK